MDDVNIVTKKIRFFPNTNQKILFKKCLGTHRYFYNKSIAEINRRYEEQKKEFNNSKTCILCDNDKLPNSYCCKKHEKSKLPWKLNIILSSIRKAVLKSDKEIIDTPDSWQLDIPYDTRQLAIKDAINAYNSSIALKNNGYIDKFELKFKKRNNNKQIFWVDKYAMRKDWKIFVTRLKDDSKLRFKKRDLKKLPKELPQSDFKILNDSGSYYLILSIPYKKPEISEKKYSMIALDPGIRCFQTGYSPDNHCIKIGSNYNNIINKYHKKIDKLKELRSKIANRKTRYNLKKRYRKTEKKLRDIIFDMHNQTTSYLSHNYEHILLPTFGTSEMLKKNKLCSYIKRLMGTFSFDKFKRKLLWLCNKNDSNLYIVTEEYTSKTCTNCGKVKDNLGKNTIYNCDECKLKIERDINGARNILLKYLI